MVYVPSLAEKIVSVLRRKGFATEIVSRRPGHEIVAVSRGSRRVLLWLRSSPISKRALALFARIVGNRGFDTVIVTKRSMHANPARLPGNWIVVDLSTAANDIEAIDRIVEEVQRAFAARSATQ